MTSKRLPAHTMKIGAAIIAAWIAFEGFTPAPVIPTKGDVPTIGHGATHYEDGTRVTMADKPITRQRAAELATNLLEQEYGTCVRESLGETPVNETEFKLAVDFAGNFGCRNWSNSSMVKYMRAGQYEKACGVYLQYRFQNKRDCKLPQNWGPQGCKGVYLRSVARFNSCMGAL